VTSIPEDIRAKAEELCLALDVPQTVALVIAQALMEERAANAKRVHGLFLSILTERDRRAIKRDLILQWLQGLEAAIRNPTP